MAGVGVLAAALVATPSLLAAASPDPSPTVASASLPTDSLSILLTNDDGYSAPGINAVYDALVAAGHDVTMVAPLTNQSGVSARVQFSGTTTATHPVAGDDNIWAVDLTPAGSLLFGLDVVFGDERPDLVISGTNVGSNTGFDTNFSGTIGAATVASGMFDIPALAVSTETERGKEATAAYGATADLVVDLLDRGLPLLPRGQFLNINYPLVGDGHPALQGVRYAANSQASAAAFGYDDSVDDPATEEIEYRIVGARGTEPHAPGTDAYLLREGWVTLGVLDADRSVGAAEVPAVADLVRALNDEPTPPATPAVEPLPTAVKRGTPAFVGTRAIPDGSVLKVRWAPIADRSLKTVKRTATVRGDRFRLKAPRAGRYLVTVRLDGTRMARDVVRVK